ncbi:hypothetical protein [Algoriphagus litoralis]|uniref:hypothetical protein n=1 Tax=Algoriphagus litoralis TaxID=2202829 RepID=UPI000DB9CC3A|nr:hypothetical protein [Algoriphagus litoralis]
MRIVDHSFSTNNPEELLPLIQNRCHDLPHNARKMTFFLYQSGDLKENFKVEFLLNGLGLVYRWFYHGYYYDENGVLQQTFNDFSVDPISLSELLRFTEKDIDYAMSEWLELRH